MDIKHEQHVPIKEAIAKYRAIQNMNNTNRWIRESIKYVIGDVLMVQTEHQNKWVCNKERLEYSDFDIILEFVMNYVPGLLLTHSLTGAEQPRVGCIGGDGVR